jgi:hypothetical protein
MRHWNVKVADIEVVDLDPSNCGGICALEAGLNKAKDFAKE